MLNWLKGLAGTSYADTYQGDVLSRKLAAEGKNPDFIETSNNTGIVSGNGFGMGGMGDMAGMLGGIAQAGQLGLGLANYGLQKDQFAFNKMNANRNYEAEKTKYNNSVDRTAAVNDFYGSKNTATRIG